MFRDIIAVQATLRITTIIQLTETVIPILGQAAAERKIIQQVPIIMAVVTLSKLDHAVANITLIVRETKHMFPKDDNKTDEIKIFQDISSNTMGLSFGV